MSNGLINRQYVGARYVPKIMGEWNKALQYEALSVVTHMGNSFTSKVPVPPNIDITNETYWVNTANYNAQVSNLTNELNDFKTITQTNINNLKTSVNGKHTNFREKNLIIVGDSWAAGYTANTGTGYVERLKELNLFKSIKTYCYGGCGYVAVSDNKSFLSFTNDIVNDYKSHSDDLDIVLYVGSVNDIGASIDSIMLNASSCYNLLRTNFPKTEIYLACNFTRGITRDNIAKLESIFKAGESYGCIPLPWVGRMTIGWSTYFTDDKYHLKHNGAVYFANNIINNLLGYFAYPSTPSNITLKEYPDMFTSDIDNFNMNNGSGIYFNNQYACIDLIDITCNLKESDNTLATIKNDIALPTYTAGDFPISIISPNYCTISDVGNMKKINNVCYLNLVNNCIVNPLLVTFPGLSYGSIRFIYDKINLCYPNYALYL